MNVKEAYRHWSGQYDTNKNLTRDLEGLAKREILGNCSFKHVLEIGCGTGKNTQWLAEHAQSVTAVDLSEEMLAIARQKVPSSKVTFKQTNILEPWQFADKPYDLVTFSLVLEHIQELKPIFRKAGKVLKPGGLVYVGELHPFKQYSGTKARYQTASGEQVVECYTHNVSEFISAATAEGFQFEEIREYFDENDQSQIPRILSLVFRKK
jgi:ubiquinone/menaquinone biosynthesis C-methylase UbiE